ncbi:MAG TPA: ABC transporter permease [Longimicrobium sp.]|nr:ABC transporter permease [Longimicrobium sp.]
MNAFGRGKDRLRRILGADVETEVESELGFHLLMRIRDLEAAGLSPAAAREQAARQFGDFEAIQRECRTIARRRNRTMRRREWMAELRQDARFGFRQLRRNPGFALLTVLMLALGIGASTAIFSIVNGVLLRALPFPEADRLVAVYQVDAEGAEGNFSHPNFVDVKERTRSFAALAEHASGSAPVVVGGTAVRVPVAWISSEFFSALGVGPVLGRTLLPEEFATGAPVAMVSDAFWRQHLGADRDLAARTVRVGDQPLTVVGVLPPGMNLPGDAGLWRPQGPLADATRTGHNWQVVGRLRAGVPPEAASRELRGIAQALKREHGDDTMIAGAAVVPLHEVVVGGVRPMLLVLVGASGLLLLITCANVVNLLLARTAARRRELAVRRALGAGRARLVRQFVGESLALALAGGVLGAAIAAAGTRALLALEPGRLPRAGEVRVDGAALLFALGVAVVAAAGIGIVVALRASGGAPWAALVEGSRGHSAGAASHRVRAVLAAGQVALTLVLLVGAGLLARSFLRLMAVDPGYRTEGAVAMEILVPWAQGDEDRARTLRFHQALHERLGAIPGVRALGSVNLLPLQNAGGGASGTFAKIDGTETVRGMEDVGRLVREPGRAGDAVYRVASGGYFPAMGIPLVRGRLFDARDTPETVHAAVISQSLAERAWPGQDPVGRQVQYGGMDGDVRPFVIVGVVGDVRERSLDAEPQPTFYANVQQRPGGVSGPHTILLYGGDPGAVAAAARGILREMDPEIPARLSTLEEVFSASLSDRRFSLLLLGAFAAVALVLAVTGIYAIISYLVVQRTREIGIRLALGAPAGTVRGMVLRSGVLLAAAGVAVGLASALLATRLLAGLLYGIGTRDPVTFVAVPLLLLAVAALASDVPARRTTRVDPMIVMRAE